MKKQVLSTFGFVVLVSLLSGCNRHGSSASRQEIDDTVEQLQRFLGDSKQSGDDVDIHCRIPAFSRSIDFLRKSPPEAIDAPVPLYALFASRPDNHVFMEVVWLEHGFRAKGFRFEANGISGSVYVNLDKKELWAATAMHRWGCVVFPDEGHTVDPHATLGAHYDSIRLPRAMFPGRVKISILYDDDNKATAPMEAYVAPMFEQRWNSPASTRPIEPPGS